MINAENDTKPIYFSDKLPRLTIQLKNLNKILSDESAIKIFHEINKKAHITDIYNSTSNLLSELGTIVNEQNILTQNFIQYSSNLLTHISSFRKELNESKKMTKIYFYAKNLSETIDQLSKAITNQLKKSKTQISQQNKDFDIQNIISEIDSLFINFQSTTEIKLKAGKNILTSEMINQMINSFKQFEDGQKSIWARVCLRNKSSPTPYMTDITLPWNEQQIRFKGFLETVLHQLLFIAEFKERLTELESHLRYLISHKNLIQENDFNQKRQTSKNFFSKKKPFEDSTEKIPSIGKVIEIPTSTATSSETQMMEERINAFSNVVKQTRLCPKPYDRIAELKSENKRLNEIFKNGWVTSQEYENLKEKNDQLKQTINELNNKIDLIKKQINLVKNAKKRTNKK